MAPNRSIESNISKSSCIYGDKTFWFFFSRVNECDRPREPNYKSPEASLKITVGISGSFVWDLRGCWKHIFLKKKAIFPMKKSFWPIFFCNIEHEKCQGTIYKGPQFFFDKNFADDKMISLAPNRTIEWNIPKSSCFHGDKSFGSILLEWTSVTNLGNQIIRVQKLVWQLLSEL